jgi:hypothetical protein
MTLGRGGVNVGFHGRVSISFNNRLDSGFDSRLTITLDCGSMLSCTVPSSSLGTLSIRSHSFCRGVELEINEKAWEKVYPC